MGSRFCAGLDGYHIQLHLAIIDPDIVDRLLYYTVTCRLEGRERITKAEIKNSFQKLDFPSTVPSKKSL